jgi:cytosine/adenosine deaminase-related metal-dependent hydrolase
VPVGLGVDGSASNDAGHLLGEARQAMLLARVGHGPAAMTARQALEIATLGGARVLGRDDIGALAPGMAADLVAFDVAGLAQAGAEGDPVAALVFCTPGRAALSVINGRVVVREGRLLTLDERAQAAAQRAAARAILG